MSHAKQWGAMASETSKFLAPRGLLASEANRQQTIMLIRTSAMGEMKMLKTCEFLGGGEKEGHVRQSCQGRRPKQKHCLY